MVRMFLYALAWPVGIVLLLSLYGWWQSEFPEPVAEHAASPEVSVFPRAERRARQALARFEALPPPEQQRLVAELRGAIRPLPAWFDRLGRADAAILCVGEFHAPSTRRFLAEALIPGYPPDVLLLEATPSRLDWILSRTAAGRDYVPLLGADIAGVVRAARAANPHVRIHGIEETTRQWRTRQGHEGSRDRSLARNFWSRFEPGARHVLIYGALHCSDEPGWLYRLLRVQSPPREAVRMQSVQVIGAHQNAAVAGFVYFLEGVGVPVRDFAIPDTDRLPPEVRHWFGLLQQQILARMDAVVVFRARAPDPPRPRSVPAPDPGELPQWVPAGTGA